MYGVFICISQGDFVYLYMHILRISGDTGYAIVIAKSWDSGREMARDEVGGEHVDYLGRASVFLDEEVLSITYQQSPVDK